MGKDIFFNLLTKDLEHFPEDHILGPYHPLFYLNF